MSELRGYGAGHRKQRALHVESLDEGRARRRAERPPVPSWLQPRLVRALQVTQTDPGLAKEILDELIVDLDRYERGDLVGTRLSHIPFGDWRKWLAWGRRR